MVPNLWVALGVGNLLGFGCSLLMYKKNFNEQFAYRNEAKMFKPIKSWFASDNLLNVAWTSPSLILGGMYMQKKVGGMTLFKFFFCATLACYGTQIALGPRTYCKDMNIRGAFPKSMRFDCIRDDGSMVGADTMAASILYFACAANGLFIPMAAFAAFDVAYYGPHMLGAPAVAAVCALTML